jgi:hypothetical protein
MILELHGPVVANQEGAQKRRDSREKGWSRYHGLSNGQRDPEGIPSTVLVIMELAFLPEESFFAFKGRKCMRCHYLTL